MMTGFMNSAVARLAARFPAAAAAEGASGGAGGGGAAAGADGGASRARVAVVQFSNDVRVELVSAGERGRGPAGGARRRPACQRAAWQRAACVARLSTAAQGRALPAQQHCRQPAPLPSHRLPQHPRRAPRPPPRPPLRAWWPACSA